MQITITDDAGSTAKIVLAGKLDFAGAGVIEKPLATLAESKNAVLIDMTGVTFLESMAIRHILLANKVLARRGGHLYLLNPNEMVTDVLVTSGVSSLLNIVRSESEAPHNTAG
jgi:anti-anti-sigma factor